MNCRDVYLQHTDVQGKAMVSYHRVWDKELFIRSTQERYNKGNPDDRRTVHEISESQYKSLK